MSATQARSFGDLLREYRVGAGLTQEMLAERARMSLAAISKLECGTRQRPYRATIAQLADALSLPASDRSELERAAQRSAHTASARRRDVAVTTNLPAHLSSFVGREDDLERVREMLSAHRLVTLVGAGGVGKTRLAVRVAEEFTSVDSVEQRFDAVWFVDLSSLSDDAMIAMTLASAIGVHLCQTMDALIAYLRSQTFLLVLDNCEHVVDPLACAAKALMSGCPNARILATSRQALSLDGEHIYRVPPLNVPLSDALSARDALEFDAIRLFKDRAEAMDSRFELSDSVVPAVVEICQRVDGIALAVELAAARTNAFSPASIAHQIAAHLSLLTGNLRAAVPRHKAMRSLFDWSYDLLDGRERELFRRSSIFAGGFSQDLMGALYEDDDQKVAAPELLASLVDKSLVQCDILVEPARYRLLEPARQYAREKLHEHEEQNGAARSHALALLALAEAFDARLDLVSDYEWDAYIERERDNFRAALEWALGANGDSELGGRLAASRTATWSGFRSGEVRNWMDAALESCSETTFPGLLAKLAIGRARTAVIFGSAWHPETGPEAIVEACRRACTLQSADNLRGVAMAQFWLGAALQNMGRYDEADNELRGAREAARSAGARTEYNSATMALSGVRYGVGDLIEARELASETVQRSEEAGCERVAADARAYLAEIAFASGAVDEALLLNQKTTQFFRSHSNLVGLPLSLHNSAAYLIALQRYPEAREVAREALQRSRAIGSPRALFWSMQHLAAVAVFSVPPKKNDTVFRRVANLLGFVDESTRQRDILRYFTEQQEYDKVLSVLRGVLGQDDLATLIEAGKSWSEVQAVTAALAI